jgi:MerR family transcriptional regulator, redox-sensitive transcriptional activator SoxR
MLSIGEVARHAGMRPSAIRYYERIGLMPPATRRSGRRVYGEGVLRRLAVISFARASGFTLREIRSLFTSSKPYSARLREQARAKVKEIDAMIARAKTMKALLNGALRCNCVDLDHCGRLMLDAAGKRRPAA